jgi:hypothetical protein
MDVCTYIKNSGRFSPSCHSLQLLWMRLKLWAPWCTTQRTEEGTPRLLYLTSRTMLTRAATLAAPQKPAAHYSSSSDHGHATARHPRLGDEKVTYSIVARAARNKNVERHRLPSAKTMTQWAVLPSSHVFIQCTSGRLWLRLVGIHTRLKAWLLQQSPYVNSPTSTQMTNLSI